MSAKPWSAKAAARAWERAFLSVPRRDDGLFFEEDCRRLAAEHITRAYLAALSAAFRNGPTGLADFVRDERARLAAPKAGAKGKRK